MSAEIPTGRSVDTPITSADSPDVPSVASSGDLVLVDVYDREVGSASKERCHAEGLLHRAFSVFLMDGDRMLLQRRALGKYHSGGLWTNACCSHPRLGEGLSRAVSRRLEEELGVRGCPTREVGSFVYRHVFATGLVEHEFDHVLVGEWSGQVSPDPDEVMDMRWVGRDELAGLLLAEPDSFTVWFHTAAPMVLAATR